jgi:DNA-binding transcriptional regulator YhcF (GntR family)
MSWEFKPDRPIYTQLLEQIQIRIVIGVYPPGSQLLSVREFAAQAAVNPNTMQKALAELERMELVYTKRTAGRFITEDRERIAMCKDNMVTAQVGEFCERMKQFGLTKEELVELLNRAYEEE